MKQLLLVFLMLFGSTLISQAEEPAVLNHATLLQQMKEQYAQPTSSVLAKSLGTLPDKGNTVLRKLVLESEPLAESFTAELLWQLFVQKNWSNDLCNLAADLLKSSDPVAVTYAEWALAIRVGWENSAEVAPWSETMENPPQWFTQWLAFPQERLTELEYWRIGVSHSVHYSHPALYGTAVRFLERTSGVLKEIVEKKDSVRQTAAQNAFTEAEKILRQMAVEKDMLVLRQLYSRFRLQTRKVVLLNPSLDFEEILFTKRHSVHGLRNITGSQYPWSHKPGGDLCVKTGWNPTDPVREILSNQLGPGHVHGTDLHWDGERIVFGYAQQPVWPLPKPTHQNDAHHFFGLRKQTPPLHLYEIRLDGTGLRQITDHPFWGDFEPTYASDGSIVFASDRSGRSSECGNFNADHTVINLYRCNADGSDVRMISDNKDIDRYPHALDNGLIGYTRWEYQERHFTEVHAFWTVRPDGTYAEAAYKQHFSTPWALRDTRSVPNSNKYVSIATGHHTLAYGQIVLFDLLGGPNDASRLMAVTPNITTGEGPSVRKTVPQGGIIDNIGRYSGPFPLSETTFLASYSSHIPGFQGKLGGDTQFAIFLTDVYGNKELLHRERIYSCDFPTPVKKRNVPFQIADGRMSTEDFPWPICYVEDIYKGMPQVERGKVKYLRIMQRIGWPLDEKIGAMRYIPKNAWDKIYGFWSWAPAREIGLVPVEEDGSANFYVPANQAIYFQALDENKVEVRRMRSHISLENGESRGCIGCHETQAKVVSAKPGTFPQALGRLPSLPQEPAWGSENLLAYETHIQPVFNRHCIACHNDEQMDGNFNLSNRRDETTGMLQSYLTLFPDGVMSGLRNEKITDAKTGQITERLPLVSLSNRHSGAGVTNVQQFGSSQSRLIRTLLDDPFHADEIRGKMSEEEWSVLVSWVDANAPYYDTFYNRRPEQGEKPIRDIRKTFPIPMHETVMISEKNIDRTDTP